MAVRILAWDYSGSTDSMAYYHTHGESYLRQFREAKDGGEGDQDQVFLLWSSYCKEISLEQLQDIIWTKKGCGETRASTIVSWIQENVQHDKEIELWLITDGEIDRDQLSLCAQLNSKVNYKSINFIVINKSPINMSVGASFFRGAKLKIFQNENLFKEINTALPFDYDQINVSNFYIKYLDLSDFIQAKFMGSDLDSLQEVEKLTALRRRLLAALGKEAQPEAQGTIDFSSKSKSEILTALKSCRFYKTLTTPAVKSQTTKIDSTISSLINYIHNKNKSMDFQALKLDFKQDQMAVVEAEAEPKVGSLQDAEICSFYDAVTLENEHAAPILLLTITDLIEKYWENGNHSKFQTVLDCPFMAKIDECIGHVYLIETFQAMSVHDGGYENLINPMTNQPVYGGLIFSEKADKWNDYVLIKTFFRGKKVSTNIALWYYVIWRHALNKAWIEADVLQALKTYAFRRLSNAKVKLGFSSLPLEPKEIVRVSIACFFCTEGSSLLFGQDGVLFLQERLRMFWPVADQMLEILSHFGYEDLNTEFVQKRAKTFELVTALKRIPQQIEKRYYLLGMAFEKEGKFLTYKVKNKKAIRYLHLLGYHHKDSMIPFNFDEKPVKLKDFVLVSYADPFYDKIEIPISRKTCRPSFVIWDKSRKTVIPYFQQLKDCCLNVELDSDGEIKGMSAVTRIDYRKLISTYKCFVDLTKDLARYPTLDEYTEYIFKVKRIHENTRVRLFFENVLPAIRHVFEEISKFTYTVDVKTFIQLSQKSVSIMERVEMENRLERVGLMPRRSFLRQ